MCRIAGIVNKNIPLAEIEGMVKEMCDLQKHGGPDDEGLFVSEENNLVLGNRRLALLDLTHEGHMPMHYIDRYCITYNGELYNYLSLKDDLIQKGYQFQNQTDTEVIMAAFAHWGTLCFAKFKGMFAFALFDKEEKELYLVRDTAGIKPLYVSNTSGMLAFASEIRAFKSIPSINETNANWPVYMMAYGHLPEPITTLSAVKPLHKGCYIKYEIKKDRYSMQSYAHYSYTHQIVDSTEAKGLLRNQLEASVASHMLADAKVGVFLSGGLDSSIIATLASKYKQTDFSTLSIHFEDPAFSEKKYQDVLIDKLKCNHNQHLLTEAEFQHSFSSILDSMDMPSCDGINTWFISKHAAEKGLKAVLSGVGGDELFGGYPSFNRMNIAKGLQLLPYSITQFGKYTKSKRLNRLAYLKMDGIKGLYLFLRGHYSPNEIALQFGAYEQDIWNVLNEHPIMNDISVLENKEEASWMEFNLYMQNQLLRDADVMSMIHGVEIRLPFLDNEVIRLANKISPAVKFNGNRPKQFLIDTFKEELPEMIWNRPKMGFSFPFAKWLGESDFVRNAMINSNTQSQHNYQKFLKGNLHWSQFISLVIMQHRGVV